MTAAYSPSQILRRALSQAVDQLPYWFVIGGQAVRCFAPYRPSRDVDFGIDKPANLDDLVEQLGRHGPVEVQERSADTVHLSRRTSTMPTGRRRCPARGRPTGAW